MPGVIQIVRVSPVSTVNENDCGMRAGTLGQPQIAELQRVGSIGNARVGFGRRQGQDVLAQGGSGGSGSQKSSSSHEQHYCTGEGTRGTPVILVFLPPNHPCPKTAGVTTTCAPY